jgi:hypothetical protein
VRRQIVEVDVTGDEPAAGDEPQRHGMVDPGGLAIAAAAAGARASARSASSDSTAAARGREEWCMGDPFRRVTGSSRRLRSATPPWSPSS